MKFTVYQEELNPASQRLEPVNVEFWCDVQDVMFVRTHDFDRDWSILTYKPGGLVRKLIVKGLADDVAALVAAEKRRQV